MLINQRLHAEQAVTPDGQWYINMLTAGCVLGAEQCL
jgi:hypothetical protein